MANHTLTSTPTNPADGGTIMQILRNYLSSRSFDCRATPVILLTRRVCGDPGKKIGDSSPLEAELIGSTIYFELLSRRVPEIS
jgi:hypothetical protein